MLKRYVNDAGYYVIAFVSRNPVVFELSEDGEKHLTKVLGLEEGAYFGVSELTRLIDRRWVDFRPYTIGPSSRRRFAPADIDPDAFELETAYASQLDRRVMLRFTSSDHSRLDATIRALVQTLGEAEIAIEGPFPLPTRIEQYRVISTSGSKDYRIHTHKRLLTLLNPSASAIQKVSSFSMPPIVDLTITDRIGPTMMEMK
jgi:small subunit ribosomal protein S10